MGWQQRHRHQMRDQVTGTIGVLAGELGRFTAFHQCMAALERPAGATVKWECGTANVAGNRNDLVREMAGEWLWMIDDDHVFASDILLRLLARFDDERVDAVVPFCLMRKHPCPHVLFTLPPDGGVPESATIPPEAHGLVQVDAAGAAGMLVRRRVFDRIGDPWFEVGRFVPRRLDEDLWFCQRMKDVGARLFCDLDIAMGHVSAMAVWPTPRRVGYRLQPLFCGTEQAKAAAAMERLEEPTLRATYGPGGGEGFGTRSNH